MKICPICKIEFIGRKNKIYCGKRCKRRQKRRNRAVRNYERYLERNPWLKPIQIASEEFRARLERTKITPDKGQIGGNEK